MIQDSSTRKPLLSGSPFAFLVLSGAFAFFSANPAQAAGDAYEGGKLAKIWCSACHVVSDDQQSGSEAVPSFAAIAALPERNEETLSAFLRDPHVKMPDMNLSNTEIADLVAYILSQKR